MTNLIAGGATTNQNCLSTLGLTRTPATWKAPISGTSAANWYSAGWENFPFTEEYLKKNRIEKVEDYDGGRDEDDDSEGNRRDRDEEDEENPGDDEEGNDDDDDSPFTDFDDDDGGPVIFG
eukprot:CAMPEP_0170469672 /NCGR_PEP_ID=MMETSP0123-20130129/12426_1 /TAXON_ID=182087 /ORGANISM="Favella ehrenbergii, Strain Fehren 1" /LENGTH=120 /DNA_ID=CAMNT_0010736623 /DNA_START=683 /DNA_END=1044 /DNA_ORIENTATION=+